MSLPCTPCNGTGVVVKWNLNDDSGDGVDVCTNCGGYGYTTETKPNA